MDPGQDCAILRLIPRAHARRGPEMRVPAVCAGASFNLTQGTTQNRVDGHVPHWSPHVSQQSERIKTRNQGTLKSSGHERHWIHTVDAMFLAWPASEPVGHHPET